MKRRNISSTKIKYVLENKMCVSEGNKCTIWYIIISKYNCVENDENIVSNGVI